MCMCERERERGGGGGAWMKDDRGSIQRAKNRKEEHVDRQ